MKSFFTQLSIILFTLTLVLTLNMGVITATAQSPAPESVSVGTYLRADNQEQPKDIGNYIVRIINFLSAIIGSFAFLAIIIGGMMLLISGGNETQVQKGKDIITYSIIGLIIALSAYFLTSAVQSLFFEYGQK